MTAAHTLVLIRHGKSDWSGVEADHERPLAKRGKRQAPEAGSWIAGNQPLDLAVVSSATRAQQTWRLVAGELVEVPSARQEERVYAATAEELLTVVRGLPEEADAVAIVGHNPGLEDLVAMLSGEWIRMPTSAVAVIDLDVAWADASAGSGRLRTSGRPPEPATAAAGAGGPPLDEP